MWRDSIGYFAWRFSEEMGARLEQRLRSLDLTLAQYNALNHAAQSPGISSAEAARRTGITAQSMGAAVTQLADRGLLERRPHPTNRRVLCLHITDTGEEMAKRAQAVIDGINADALSVLTPVEQATAYTLMRRLVEHLSPETLPTALPDSDTTPRHTTGPRYGGSALSTDST